MRKENLEDEKAEGNKHKKNMHDIIVYLCRIETKNGEKAKHLKLFDQVLKSDVGALQEPFCRV